MWASGVMLRPDGRIRRTPSRSAPLRWSPVSEAFDWRAADTALPAGEWYMVAFRSVRRADADEALLCRYDELAHEEAARSSGFVHYYRGPMMPDGGCLSFCLLDTRVPRRRPHPVAAHVEAVGPLDEMYESYRLEFLRVRLDGGAEPWAFAASPTHGRRPRRRATAPRVPARRPPLRARRSLIACSSRASIDGYRLLAAIVVRCHGRHLSAVPIGPVASSWPDVARRSSTVADLLPSECSGSGSCCWGPAQRRRDRAHRDARAAGWSSV